MGENYETNYWAIGRVWFGRMWVCSREFLAWVSKNKMEFNCP
jgi:hypothetical protein